MGGKKRPRGWRVKNNTPKISAVTKWGFRKDRSVSKERIKFGFTRIEDSWPEKEDAWRRMIDSCDSGSRNILYVRNFLHSVCNLNFHFLQKKRKEKKTEKKGEDSKRICSSLENSANTLGHKILKKKWQKDASDSVEGEKLVKPTGERAAERKRERKRRRRTDRIRTTYGDTHEPRQKVGIYS